MLPVLAISQDFIDLLKISRSSTFSNRFEGYEEKTEVNSMDIDLTLPIVLDDKNIIVTGVTYSKNNLELYPSSFYEDSNNVSVPGFTGHIPLYTTILKIGYSTNFSERLSGAFIAFPKLASDYSTITSDDLYLGGIALFKYKKKENLFYRFGLYAMGQSFGLVVTPILGLYYKSPNQNFEMDIMLPGTIDINHVTGKNTKVGFDYVGIGRSFDIHKTVNPELYVDYGALELTGYFQYGFFENSVLLRTKIGYETSNFRVYEKGDTVDLRVLAFNFGDDRNQINPTIRGGLFGKFEIVYRFKISSKEK
jgi:hypothetical protein